MKTLFSSHVDKTCICAQQDAKSGPECSPEQDPELTSAEEPDALKVIFSLSARACTALIRTLNCQHVVF